MCSRIVSYLGFEEHTKWSLHQAYEQDVAHHNFMIANLQIMQPNCALDLRMVEAMPATSFRAYLNKGCKLMALVTGGELLSTEVGHEGIH